MMMAASGRQGSVVPLSSEKRRWFAALRLPPTLIHPAASRFQPTTFRLPVSMTIRHATADDLRPTWMCRAARLPPTTIHLEAELFLLTATQVVVQFHVTELQDQRRIINDEDLSVTPRGSAISPERPPDHSPTP